MHIPTRQEAWNLLNQYNKKENLLTHALTVESVMGHFANYFQQENIEKWKVIGLIHDLDYEQYPDEHCQKTKQILEENDWPEDYIRAVVSHGYGVCSDVKPIELVEKVLFTIDELTGLISATALMRPSKSILDLEVKSVIKKWKQKSFAKGVDREIIENGAKELGLDVNEVIKQTIHGMCLVADIIGLQGELSKQIHNGRSR